MLLPKLLGALGALSLAQIAVAIDTPRYVRRNESTDSVSSEGGADEPDGGFTILTDDHGCEKYKDCWDDYRHTCKQSLSTSTVYGTP